MKAVSFAHGAKPRRSSLQRGFTLFELMLTIAVAAVIAGYAAPSFLDTIRANRISTDNNELVSAMALARSEAIKSGIRTTVCTSADQATCAGAGGWEQGWIVFSDPSGAGTVDGGEVILRVWEPLDGGTTIRAPTAFANYVSFVGTGETRGDTANLGTFQVCGKTNDIAEGRTITVSVSGYAKTQPGVAACP